MIHSDLRVKSLKQRPTDITRHTELPMDPYSHVLGGLDQEAANIGTRSVHPRPEERMTRETTAKIERTPSGQAVHAARASRRSDAVPACRSTTGRWSSGKVAIMGVRHALGRRTRLGVPELLPVVLTPRPRTSRLDGNSSARLSWDLSTSSAALAHFFCSGVGGLCRRADWHKRPVQLGLETQGVEMTGFPGRPPA